jgi:integrin beta 3
LIDGATEFTVRLTRGDQTKEWKIAKPTLADMHKGIWHEGQYKRGDVVTWGGSQWLAMVDTEARPETTKDWVLVVKRGRDGKDLMAAEPKPSKTVKL